MSQININNEKDLMRFLKILAEETSIKSLKEYDKSYDEKYKADTDRYGSLSEQEDEDIFSDEGESEAAPEETPAANDSDNSDETEVNDVPVTSYESVKVAINAIRAGKSLKTDDVDQNLSAYYERLSEEERLVLQTYLSSVSSIIGLSKKGDEAQDPGDPPVSITMTSADEEADAAAEESVPEDETPPDESEEAEDTSPPIQVSESKNLSKDNQFRNKIRHLLER